MKEKNIGIIDLGSNSIRFVVYEIEETGGYKEILNVKKSARLSMHIDKKKNITSEGMHIIIDILSYFQELSQYYQIEEVHGVATAVIREAPNYEYVLENIKKETDFTFEILSGEKEGFYGYLAVANSTSIRNGVTIDIGGASTEVTLFTNRELRFIHSFPFGAITLTKQFIAGDKPTKKEMDTLSAFLLQQFSEIKWLKKCKQPVIGIGGSARNMSLIHQHSCKYPLKDIHQYEIATKDIKKVKNTLLTLSLQKRRRVKGLSKERADIIIPAIEAIYQLTQVVKAPRFIMSSKGIRDGLFYQKILMDRNLHLFPNVLDESTFQLRNQYAVDIAHADHLADLSIQLYKGIQAKLGHEMQEKAIFLLTYGAKLSYLGEALSVKLKSKHTFYLLKNSVIEGVSQKDRIKIATISSFKSRECMSKNLQSFKDWFSKDEWKQLEFLGSLIKIAYGLERTKRQLTKHVYVSSMHKKKLTFHVTYVSDNRYEQEYVQLHKKHLEKVIQKNVYFTFEKISM